MVLVIRALICLLLLSLGLTGCAGGGEPFTGPSSAGQPVSRAVSDRDQLARVARAVNLRESDLPDFEGSEAPLMTDPRQQRAREQFAQCLGLGESLRQGTVRSDAFRNGAVPPFVEWSSTVSRHPRVATIRAVRMFGTAAGARCWRPVVEQLLGAAVSELDDTRVEALALAPFSVERGRTEAASGVRATAVLRSPQSSVTFGLDFVLATRKGLTVGLYGNSFGQLPDEQLRSELVSTLSRRLVAVTS